MIGANDTYWWGEDCLYFSFKFSLFKQAFTRGDKKLTDLED